MTHSARKLSVAFPDTVLEEHVSLRDKTLKIGQIARTCSVFGVDVVQIFRDARGLGESGLIKHVLEYLETPQYLRRRLFPLDDTLRFAGLLPPLRIPSHKPRVPVAQVSRGELREGVTLADGSAADIGLDVPVALKQRTSANRRVTVKVLSASPLSGMVVDRSEATEYWGYTVEVRSSDEVLNDDRFDLKVATSRLGDPLADSLPALREDLSRSRGTVAIFGSPSRGLFEMVKDLRGRAKFVLNLYPDQHVVTVRTEEAMASALYLFEVLRALKNTKV